MPRKGGVNFWQKEILWESRIQTVYLYPEVYSVDLIRLLCQKMKRKLPAVPQTKQFVRINILHFVNYNYIYASCHSTGRGQLTKENRKTSKNLLNCLG